MGDALVMFTVPEEALGRARTDPTAPPTPPYHWLTRQRGSGKKKVASTEPYHLLPVRSLAEAIWNPPPEPRLDWHEDPRLRRAHLKAARESLEEFLNAHLARLSGMVRTGGFVLGEVRVKVVECRQVPEKARRGRTKAPEEKKEGGARRTARPRGRRKNDA